MVWLLSAPGAQRRSYCHPPLALGLIEEYHASNGCKGTNCNDCVRAPCQFSSPCFLLRLPLSIEMAVELVRVFFDLIVVHPVPMGQFLTIPCFPAFSASRYFNLKAIGSAGNNPPGLMVAGVFHPSQPSILEQFTHPFEIGDRKSTRLNSSH